MADDWRDLPARGVRMQPDGDATFSIVGADGVKRTGRLTPAEAEMVRLDRANKEKAKRDRKKSGGLGALLEKDPKETPAAAPPAAGRGRSASSSPDEDAERQSGADRIMGQFNAGLGGILDLLNPFDTPDAGRMLGLGDNFTTGSAAEMMNSVGINAATDEPEGFWENFARGSGEAASALIPTVKAGQVVSQLGSRVFAGAADDATKALLTKTGAATEVGLGGVSRVAGAKAEEAGAGTLGQTAAAVIAPVAAGTAVMGAAGMLRPRPATRFEEPDPTPQEAAMPTAQEVEVAAQLPDGDLAPQPRQNFFEEPNPSMLEVVKNTVKRAILGEEGESRPSFYEDYVDYFSEVQTFQRDAADAGLIPDADAMTNPYQVHTLAESQAGRRSELLHNRVQRPISNLIKENGLNLKMVDGFLLSRHANERDAFIASKSATRDANGNITAPGSSGGSGFTAEMRAEFGEAYGRLDPNQKQALEEIGKMHDSMIDDMIDYRVDTGLISPEEAAAWRANFKHYVPLKGEGLESQLDDLQPPDLTATPFQSPAQGVVGAETREATGRGDMATDLLANSLAQAQSTIKRGADNRVMQAMYDLVDNINMSRQAGTTDADTDVDTSSLDARARLREEGEPIGENTLQAKVGGEKRQLVLDPRLTEAFKSMSSEDLKGLLGAVNFGTKFVAGMQTRNNPFFALTNGFRDVQSMLLNNALDSRLTSEQRRGALRHLGSAMWSAIKATRNNADFQNPQGMDRYAQEFFDSGAATRFSADPSVKGQQRRLEADVRMPNGFRDAGDMIKFMFQGAGDAAETAPRLALFTALRKSGSTVEEAATAAKELTVNFNRRGHKSRGLGAWVMFANAAIQGGDNAARRIMRDKKRWGAAMAGLAGTGMAVDQMLSGLQDETLQEWDNIPEHEKAGNWIIPTSMEPGNWQYAKIPKPFVFRAFDNMGRWGSESARGTRNGMDFLTGAVGEISAQFAPTPSISGDNLGPSAALLISPDAVDPLVETGLNYQGFFDQQINFSNEERGQAARQGDPTVDPMLTPMAEWMNELFGTNEAGEGAINLHPRDIAHVLRTYTGGVGRAVERGIDLATGQKDASDARQYPLIHKFIGASDDTDMQYAAYDYADRVAAKTTNFQRMLHRHITDGETPEGKAELKRYYDEHHFDLAVAGGVTDQQIAKWRLSGLKDFDSDLNKEKWVSYFRRFGKDAPAGEISDLRNARSKAREKAWGRYEKDLRGAKTQADKDAAWSTYQKAKNEADEAARAQVKRTYVRLKAMRDGQIGP